QTQAAAPAQATANVAQPAESAAISAVAPLSEQDEKDNLGNANADSKDAKNDPTAVVGKDGEELSDEEKRVVNELASIDTKVHEHENAHLAAAGGLAQGGADYTYTEGPDGKLYATAGEVSIDTSSTGDAQKDVQKAQQIQAAAMAPADPSPQDYRVAADAAMMQMEAQMKVSEELSAELRKTEGVKLYQENMDFFERERTAPRSFQAVA
ncbi:MAG: hypothetical protein K2N20_07180, partial [Helicobacter sp.]|nr:hypothetical protein [Helicobacter sp.]